MRTSTASRVLPTRSIAPAISVASSPVQAGMAQVCRPASRADAACLRSVMAADRAPPGVHSAISTSSASAPARKASISADVADWVRATGLALLASEETGPGEFEFHIGK